MSDSKSTVPIWMLVLVWVSLVPLLKEPTTALWQKALFAVPVLALSVGFFRDRGPSAG